MSAVGFEARIAPELQPMAQPMAMATPHPQNVRKHRVEKIMQSLQQHGQRAPIIVQKSTRHIVKGNGTYEAAKTLGWDTIAMSVQDMDDNMALAFLYADNRTSDLATYDRKKLREGLAAMVTGPGLFDTLWEVEEFEDLDEEFRGIATLPTKQDAAGDTLVETSNAAPAPKADPARKMREVPIVLTAAEHALFIEWVGLLKRAFGLGGSQETIYEAVKRQAELEVSGMAVTGRYMDSNARATVIAEWLLEFKRVVGEVPMDIATRHKVSDIIEQMTPKMQHEAPAVVPGQTTMLPNEDDFPF